MDELACHFQQEIASSTPTRCNVQTRNTAHARVDLPTAVAYQRRSLTECTGVPTTIAVHMSSVPVPSCVVRHLLGECVATTRTFTPGGPGWRHPYSGDTATRADNVLNDCRRFHHRRIARSSHALMDATAWTGRTSGPSRRRQRTTCHRADVRRRGASPRCSTGTGQDLRLVRHPTVAHGSP